MGSAIVTIPKELAKQEFNKWLDFKRIKPAKREQNKASENSIIDSFMDGNMVLNENHSITYTLDFPITNDDGEVTVRELKIKPRVFTGELNAALSTVDATTPDGRIFAYIKALTSEVNGILNKIDSGDYAQLQNIVTYFL